MVSVAESLEESIKGYDLFFDRIIDMIPRDLYKPAEEEDEEVLNQRYHKHRKKPLQTDERKALSKKRLEEVYQPEESKRKTSAEEGVDEENNTSGVAEEDDFDEEPSVDDGLDALRKRLQERIAHLRGNRSSGDRSGKRGPKGKQIPKNKPAKTHTTTTETSEADRDVDDVAKQVSKGVLEDMLSHGKEDTVDVDGDVIYSGLVDNNVGAVRADSGKSGSKLRRLNKLIEDAEKKKKRINDLKSQGEAGKAQAIQEQWNDVLKEAAGSKVTVNPAKIKKAIKRKEKIKEKSAREWAERTANLESTMNKKIEKREENLLKRKRGPDWVLSPEEEKEQKAKKATEKKRGVPINSKFGNSKSKDAGRTDSNFSDGKKKGRAGFEGKKVEFLNKKQKK